MSYDYNAILGEIQQLRLQLIQNHHESEGSQSDLDRSGNSSKLEILQRLVDQFADFSNKCPMTPLLWAQYAYDAGELMQCLLEDESDLDAGLKSNWETQRGILELGVAEFPACALLRRIFLEIQCRIFYMQFYTMGEENQHSELDKYAQGLQIKEAYHDAWYHVGRGSHRTDDVHVVAIHQLYISFLARSITKPDECKELILEAFLERAQSPMKVGNDSIMDDLKLFGQEHNIAFADDDLQKVESVRRLEVKHFGILTSLEEDVQLAMVNEGIVPSASLLQYFSDLDHRGFIDWANLLRNSSQQLTGNFLMGGGMQLSSKAFQKYAEVLIRCEQSQWNKLTKSSRNTNRDDDEDESISKEVTAIITSLIVPVYERAVSECPTVECLWIDYIQYLSSKLEQEAVSTSESSSFVEGARKLSSVTARSIRNCPYSLRLYGYRFYALQYESQAGLCDFSPDKVLNIINEALKSNFISAPQGALDLYLSLIKVFKERILTLVSRTSASKNFDEPESLENYIKKAKKLNKDSESSLAITLDPVLSRYGETLNDEIAEKICDLIDDIREIFDTASNYLKVNFSSWTLGKSVLCFERATIEAYIIAPLLLSLDDEDEVEDPILHYEQAVRAHQPPRHEYWRSYINYLWSETFYQVSKSKLDCNMGSGVTVGARIRFIRGIFLRALSSTKKLSASEPPSDEDNLRGLCHDFIQFEKSFGSDNTTQLAVKLVSTKMNSPRSNREVMFDSVSNPRQIVQVDEINERGKKRLKSTRHDADERLTQATTFKVPLGENGDLTEDTRGKVVHKVRIGNLDYPAHPYTVRVANLSPDVEDMDLVDVLRQYGAIVHARILREKQPHGQGTSKCTALVQFEEKASVDCALDMSGKLGLKDKQLIIERSHQPAVGLVPPGMHRKNPPREDKYSKRNEKKKGSHKSVTEDVTVHIQESTSKNMPTTSATYQDTLSFVPRSAMPIRKKVVALK